jgi:hypothetical protein
VLADGGEPVEPIDVGSPSLPQDQRLALVGVMERYQRRHSSAVMIIPAKGIEAVAHYLSQTPTHGHLQEAFAISIAPAEPPGSVVDRNLTS